MSAIPPESPAEAKIELEGLARQVESTPRFEELRPLFYRMSDIAKRFPDDIAVQDLAYQIKQRIAERGRVLQQPGATFDRATAPAEHAPPGGDVRLPDDVDHTTQQTAVPAPGPTEAPPPKQPSPAGKKRQPIIVATAAAVLCIGLIAAGWIFFGREDGDTSIALQFQSSPPGASVRVDGALRGTTNLTLNLAPGDHKIEAVLEGYEPAVSTVTIDADSPRTMNLTLVPRPQTVRIFADFREGQVLLDGELEGELQDGELVLSQVLPGEHAIEVVNEHTRAAFSVEIVPGKRPQLVSSIEARNALAVIINSAGGQAMAYSSSQMQLALDGQPAGVAGQDGIPLSGLRPGDHEIMLGEGRSARNLVATFGVSPALTAFIKLDSDAGTLVVVTGEDDVRVFLDGKEQPRRTASGQLRIPVLRAKEYRVSVRKDGYQQTPEQPAMVRKGSETRLIFKLEPLPDLASLSISGALPGADVAIDGRIVGRTDAAGAFTSNTVSAGSHTIEVHKRRYQSLRLTREFPKGGAVQISANELTTQLAMGSVRVNAVPATATILYRPIDQADSQRIPGEGFVLAAGTYVMSANAEGYLTKDVKVEVIAGETHDVEIRLAPLSQTGPVVYGMESWVRPDIWSSQGAWQVAKGTGGLIPFGVEPIHGRLSFMARVIGGKRFRWVLRHSGPENHVLFELDRRRYYRKLVKNGKTLDLLKKRLPLENPQFYTLSVEVAPGSITNRVMVNGVWVTLDTWEDPSIDFTQGKFGILTREKRQYGLSNFSYAPKD